MRGELAGGFNGAGLCVAEVNPVGVERQPSDTELAAQGTNPDLTGELAETDDEEKSAKFRKTFSLPDERLVACTLLC